MLDAVAEFDDDIMEAYLEGNEPSEEDNSQSVLRLVLTLLT